MYDIKIHFKKKMLAISFMCVLCFSACGADDNIEAESKKNIEAEAKKIVEDVEEMVLRVEDFMTDEEFTDFFEDFAEEKNGIITKIIEQDVIEVKKITEEYIVYEISAPELSDFLEDVIKEENLTADSFKEYIYDYIASADKTKIEIEVPYTYENEVFTADYTTQEFLNGITGNLLTAYQDLKEVIFEVDLKDSTYEEKEESTNCDLSNEQLCELARRYYEKVTSSPAPSNIEIDSESGDMVMIHLYQDLEEHIETIDWYTVNRYTGEGTDILGEYINLSD